MREEELPYSLSPAKSSRFEHLDDCPAVAASSPELLARVWSRWGYLFDSPTG